MVVLLSPAIISCPWSQVIRKRRMKWFDHVIRSPPNTPIKVALNYPLQPYQRPQGRPQTTWIAMFRRQLKEDHDLTWKAASMKALDKKIWTDFL